MDSEGYESYMVHNLRIDYFGWYICSGDFNHMMKDDRFFVEFLLSFLS